MKINSLISVTTLVAMVGAQVALMPAASAIVLPGKPSPEAARGTGSTFHANLSVSAPVRTPFSKVLLTLPVSTLTGKETQASFIKIDNDVKAVAGVVEDGSAHEVSDNKTVTEIGKDATKELEDVGGKVAGSAFAEAAIKDPANVQASNKDWTDAIKAYGTTRKGLAIMPPKLVAQIPAAVFAKLTAAQIAQLTPAQVAAITPDQIVVMDHTQLSALSPADVAQMTPEQFNYLCPAEIGSFTASQMAAISPQVVASMSAVVAGAMGAQAASLTIPQLQAMSPSAIFAMSPTAIQSMSTQQLSALTPAQVSTMSVSQLAALSPQQIAAFSNPAFESINMMTLNQVFAQNQGDTQYLNLPKVNYYEHGTVSQ